jgi:hypothetical protein
MRHNPAIGCLIIFLSLMSGLLHAASLGTSFTYQGQLNQLGNPVDGSANLVFSLWDEPSGGVQVAPPVAIDNVVVEDGLFTVQLDFGPEAFGGEARWLEIEVESQTLAPRQLLTAVSHAIVAERSLMDPIHTVLVSPVPLKSCEESCNSPSPVGATRERRIRCGTLARWPRTSARRSALAKARRTSAPWTRMGLPWRRSRDCTNWCVRRMRRSRS